MDMVIRFLNHTEPKYLVWLVVKALFLIGCFLFLKRSRLRWKNLGYAVLIVFFLRIFLFDQYVSWGHYFYNLTVDDVGWRQMSVLEYERNKFYKKEPVKFFTVGSSQVHAIFTDYAQKNKDVTVFYMSAMAPLDLYLYRNFIGSRQPEKIILYLSEFDMTKAPRLLAAKLAPNQGLDLLRIYPVLSDIAKKTHLEIALNEMVAGEFLPEYRYNFIFRGFIDKLMRKNDALRVQSSLAGLTSDDDQIRKEIVEMLAPWDASWLKYNTYFLEQFLLYCKDKSLKVVIVEGQYHPWAYTDKSKYLNQISRKELESIDNAFDNVVFFPREKVIAFKEEDYSDATHVKAGPAAHFADDLLEKIETSI